MKPNLTHYSKIQRSKLGASITRSNTNRDIKLFTVSVGEKSIRHKTCTGQNIVVMRHHISAKQNRTYIPVVSVRSMGNIIRNIYAAIRTTSFGHLTRCAVVSRRRKYARLSILSRRLMPPHVMCGWSMHCACVV